MCACAFLICQQAFHNHGRHRLCEPDRVNGVSCLTTKGVRGSTAPAASMQGAVQGLPGFASARAAQACPGLITGNTLQTFWPVSHREQRDIVLE